MIQQIQEQKPRRPVWVTIIFLYEILGALLVLGGLYLVVSGKTPPIPGLGTYELVVTIVLGLLNLIGSLYLFLLKKNAIWFYVVALVANILFTAQLYFAKEFLQGELSPPGILQMLFSWVIALAIIIYIHRLTQRGVLT
jgi:hypothetical protein